MKIEHMIPAAEARVSFYGILDQASKQRERFTITRNGKPQAVVMGAEEYEEWVETLEVLSNRGLVRTLGRSRKDFKEGRTVPHDVLFKKTGATKR